MDDLVAHSGLLRAEIAALLSAEIAITGRIARGLERAFGTPSRFWRAVNLRYYAQGPEYR